MPIKYFPETISLAKWGEITGNIDEQNDLINELNSKAPILHISDVDNPHNVTKSQIGLANVSNDAQLKRTSNDFNSFDEKINTDYNDIVLIEDSRNDYEKKKVKISAIGGESTGINYWLNVNANVSGSNSFYFDGTKDQSYEIIDNLFICESSNGSIIRRGIIKSTNYNNGLISVDCISDSLLTQGDKNFKIAHFIKSQNFSFYITIPGELVADTDHRQGSFYFASYDSFLLVVDAKLITAATGSPSVSWNLYKNTTALFSTAPDFGTNTSLLNLIPNINAIQAGDLISVKILTSSGTTKAADLKVQFILIPSFLLFKI